IGLNPVAVKLARQKKYVKFHIEYGGSMSKSNTFLENLSPCDQAVEPNTTVGLASICFCDYGNRHKTVTFRKRPWGHEVFKNNLALALVSIITSSKQQADRSHQVIAKIQRSW